MQTTQSGDSSVEPLRIRPSMQSFEHQVLQALVTHLRLYDPMTTMREIVDYFYTLKFNTQGNATLPAWTETTILSIWAQFFRINDEYHMKPEQLDAITLYVKMRDPTNNMQERIYIKSLRWFFEEIVRKANSDKAKQVELYNVEPWMLFAFKGNAYQMEHPIKIGVKMDRDGNMQQMTKEEAEEQERKIQEKEKEEASKRQ